MSEFSKNEVLEFIQFKILDRSLAYCFDRDYPPSCSRCTFNPCKRFEDEIVALIKNEVTEEWILAWERRLAHYAMGLTAKEANREIRTMLKEAGISVT